MSTETPEVPLRYGVDVLMLTLDSKPL